MGDDDELARENARIYLAVFVEANDIPVRKIAKTIGSPESSLLRILDGQTLPSDELMAQFGALFSIGMDRYGKLSKAEKEKISEALGSIGGGVLGFGAISATISSLGIAGLSAAGISSGLAALGAIVGGGMVAGVTIAAAIPLAVGAVGYATIRGIKLLIGSRKLASEDIDPRWEIEADS